MIADLYIWTDVNYLECFPYRRVKNVAWAFAELDVSPNYFIGNIMKAIFGESNIAVFVNRYA